MVTNFVRRRRAKQFDKDTAEAAMAAAAASRHQNFDDYEYPGRDLSGPGYGGFSADTYAQPAMASGRDAYIMHDVNAGGVGYGARDEYAGAAGAAGIGAAVGAVAMQRARSRRSAGLHGQEDYGNAYDQTPYPAFAGPGAHPLQQMHDQPKSQGSRYYQHDMMESTALGGAVGAFVNRRPSQPPLAQTVDLARNRSQGNPGPNDGGPAGSPPQDESYASHYQTVGYSDVPKDPFRRNTLRPPPASANPHDVAYGGYDEPPHHAQGSDDERESGESVREDDDYAQPRVLKVGEPFHFLHYSLSIWLVFYYPGRECGFGLTSDPFDLWTLLTFAPLCLLTIYSCPSFQSLLLFIGFCCLEGALTKSSITISSTPII